MIAPSFGAIFFNNCFQSGVLPIVLQESVIEDFMFEAHQSEQGSTFTIDLENQVIISPSGKDVMFETESFRRQALLAGLDDLGMTMLRVSEIDLFQSSDRKLRPWVYEISK